MQSPTSRIRPRRGFFGSRVGMTLMEIMVVIAIIGTIATVVAVNVFGIFSQSNVENTKLQMGTMHEAACKPTRVPSGWRLRARSGKVVITDRAERLRPRRRRHERRTELLRRAKLTLWQDGRRNARPDAAQRARGGRALPRLQRR